MIKAAFAKLEAYSARFALIFHLVRHARGKTGDRVDLESMQSALQMTEWFVHETERVYTILLADDEDCELVELATWMQTQGGETTARDLKRKGRRIYRDDTKTATEALERLVAAGWAEAIVSQGKRGRPKTTFRLVAARNAKKLVEFRLKAAMVLGGSCLKNTTGCQKYQNTGKNAFTAARVSK